MVLLARYRMSERKRQYRSFLKFGLVFICAALYAMGGSEAFGGMKWLRRYLSPAVACLGMFAFSKNWRSLPQMVLMMASLSMGYGGVDSLWAKVGRRGLFGLTNGVSSSGFNLWRKKWLLAGFQVVLLVAAYIVLGVFNPLPDARTEEFVLGVLVYFIPIMSV